jgi:hypothetical protein
LGQIELISSACKEMVASKWLLRREAPLRDKRPVFPLKREKASAFLLPFPFVVPAVYTHPRCGDLRHPAAA